LLPADLVVAPRLALPAKAPFALRAARDAGQAMEVDNEPLRHLDLEGR
jgi:hypothetical protein